MSLAFNHRRAILIGDELLLTVRDWDSLADRSPRSLNMNHLKATYLETALSKPPIFWHMLGHFGILLGQTMQLFMRRE